MSYQIIVYGATGFTGQRTTEYLAANAPADLRWAIAGRNADKLDDLKRRLNLSVDTIAVDANDADGIAQMVQQTQVLITTAGPYALYGENLIKSCAEHGTHYVDITGEVPWVQDMIARYGDAATKSGAKIIPFCGFDSVPADIGTWVARQYAREQGLGELLRVRGYYTTAGGGLNGGTLLSLLNIMETGDAKRLANPKALVKDLHQNNFIAKEQQGWREHYGEAVGRWAYPFFMDPINSKVIYRSIGLSYAFDLPRPSSFSYREFHAISKKRLPALAAATTWVGFTMMTTLSPARALFRKLGPKAGEGPSQEAMDNGYFKLQLIGTNERGAQVRSVFSYAGDPGNKATTCFLSECAMALCLDADKLPNYKGFLTPSIAFGQVLVDRLKAAGTEITAELIE